MEERKEKNATAESSQVWLPKNPHSGSLKGVGGSRSTEESSAHPKSRGHSQRQRGVGASSGGSQDSPLVFNRLNGHKEIS